MVLESATYESRLRGAYDLILHEWNLYLENLALYLTLWSLFYLLLSCVLYYAYCHYNWGTFKHFKFMRRVLIVTAHPDDECMFFGPTILELHKRGVSIYLLCLSDGNYDGFGGTRRGELWKACERLGIADSNIIMCTDSRLPDDPNVHWDTELLAEVIGHQVAIYDFNAIISFDKGGVSGHSNHCKIFFALAYLSLNKQLPIDCRIFTLDSINILRKYCCYLDLPFSYLLSSTRFILSGKEYNIVYDAMSCHKSQMLWYRYFYLVLSRYMYINTLRETTILDFELELELEELEPR